MFSIIGIFFSLYYKNSSLILIALITGWLIDTDHILDYIRAWKANVFSREALESIYSGKYFLITKKAYIIFHAWELVVIWFLIWHMFDRFDVALTGTIAWTVHLSIDHLSYRLHWHAYFLTIRLLKKFDFMVVSKDI